MCGLACRGVERRIDVVQLVIEVTILLIRGCALEAILEEG
jgi:hypothetical protein